MTIRFRITTRDGLTVLGPVQGSGGLVGAALAHLADQNEARAVSLAKLRREALRADMGLPFFIYEPRPGCCTVFPDDSAASNGRELVVDLRGASIELAP